jgi:hypothetical protein
MPCPAVPAARRMPYIAGMGRLAAGLPKSLAPKSNRNAVPVKLVPVVMYVPPGAPIKDTFMPVVLNVTAVFSV